MAPARRRGGFWAVVWGGADGSDGADSGVCAGVGAAGVGASEVGMNQAVRRPAGPGLGVALAAVFCWGLVGGCAAIARVPSYASMMSAPGGASVRVPFSGGSLETSLLLSTPRGRWTRELAGDDGMRLKGGREATFRDLKQKAREAWEVGVQGLLKAHRSAVGRPWDPAGNLGFVQAAFIPPFLRRVCTGPQSQQHPPPSLAEQEEAAAVPAADRASDLAVDCALDQAMHFADLAEADSPHLEALVRDEDLSAHSPQIERSLFSIAGEWASSTLSAPRSAQSQPAAATPKRRPGMTDAQWEALRRSSWMKDRGNKLHSEGRFEEAVVQYEGAKRILEDARKAFLVNNKESKDYNRMMIACSLNLASCCIEMCDYVGSVRHCSEALERDSNSYKALYRRGVAYRCMAGINNDGTARKGAGKELAGLAKNLFMSDEDWEKRRRRLLKLAFEDVSRAHALVSEDQSVRETMEVLQAELLAAGGPESDSK